jgi:hypothetical protein
MRISMLGNSNLRTFVIQWDEAFASVSWSPGSRSDLDYVWRFGSSAEPSIESFSGPLPTYMKLVVFGQVTQVSNLTANHQQHMVTQMLPKLPESALPIISTFPRLVFRPH